MNSNRPGVSRTEGKITDQECLKSLEPENGDKVTLGPEEEIPGESEPEDQECLKLKRKNRLGVSGESGTGREKTRRVWNQTRKVWNRKIKDQESGTGREKTRRV
jgi:hypothetical protein